MAIKVRMRVGDVEVEYEGEKAFLTKQVPALIRELATVVGEAGENAEAGGQTTCQGGPRSNGQPGPLPSFLDSKKKTKNNQVRRFLGTAEWLHLKGNSEISTADVTKALQQSRQAKLTNPCDYLNKNVAKGHCEKHGNQFFVTDEGRKALD